MDARKLFDAPEDTYVYLERHVNDGSPSGFTHLKTTSPRTNPFTGDDRFPLLEFDDTDVQSILLGDKVGLLTRTVNYAHPDSLGSPVLSASNRRPTESEFLVSPTAGARTMIPREWTPGGYLKLTYDTARIGRVDRQLSLKQCQSSLDVSRTLKAAVDQDKLPDTFSLLLESAARVSLLPIGDRTYEWGTIFREPRPYPYRQKEVQLVPGFSLFGKDRKHPRDDRVINQLISISGADPRAYLVDVLKIIVDCYWSVVLACAFYPECHSQNCLFEVDRDFRINRLVLIDMDSVDKVVPLARSLGLKDHWDGDPHARLDESVYYYPYRSSYIYDFKVGEYLMAKIARTVCRKFDLRTVSVYSEIREYVRDTYSSRLPSWFFPADGCWYDCAKTERLPGTQRQYFPHKHPKFR